MLAVSNIPLVIDQPEDDLDNAFIISAVVRLLRRQVMLVTHIANNAVLGDAELLRPMKRNAATRSTAARSTQPIAKPRP